MRAEVWPKDVSVTAPQHLAPLRHITSSQWLPAACMALWVGGAMAGLQKAWGKEPMK